MVQWIDQLQLYLSAQPLLVLIAFFAMYLVLVAGYSFLFRFPSTKRIRQINQQIAEIEAENSKDPRRVVERYSLYLEKYIERNMEQNDKIFRFARQMIVSGLVLILTGIIWDIRTSSQDTLKGPLVAIIGGIITQFLAATLLVIFRSVFQQTVEYFKGVTRMAILESAINTLENRPEGEIPALQERMDIATLILVHGLNSSQNSSTTENKE